MNFTITTPVEHYDANGKYHNDNGPAVIDMMGINWWYQHGTLHRDGAPAVTHEKGMEIWYQNGLRHRTDGPAVTCVNGAVEYWLNDKKITESEFLQTI